MTAEGERYKHLPDDHATRSTKMPWYNTDFGKKLTPKFRELLEQWSGIAPDDVVAHIYKVRESSWNVFPWPCIGEFWFIEQGILRHPDYSLVLNKLKSQSGSRFLDLGTCLGQDVRTLAYDGVPISSLYGADVNASFEAEGHNLFKDKDRFDPSHFITGDILSDSEGDELAKTRGTWDVIHIAMFLHIFSRANQAEACERILRLLKVVPGSIIIGTQTGNLDSGELVLKPPLCEPGENRTIFRQNKETMVAMWENAAAQVGLNVKVWAAYDEDHARQRDASLISNGAEKQTHFFTGTRERRIFFRVEIV